MIKPLFLSLAALPLAGCISLGGEEPPAALFTLSPTEAPAAPFTRSGTASALTVAVPKVPAAIQTLRIPVRTTATEIAYLKDAQWVEQPNRLFQQLLHDTIAARTGLTLLDPRQTHVDPGRALIGQLVEFGVDTTNGTNVKVRYDATLSGPGDRIATRRFETTEPLAAVEPRGVAQAINRAANRTAIEVAAWVATN